MFATNKLQDDVMAREEARIKMRREANESRRVRLLNAKSRLIGIDVQSLDEQVAERQRQREQERDNDRFERMQAQEIERLLAQSMEEEKQMKEYQRNQQRQDWDNAIARKKAEAAAYKGPDFDNDHCGTSSALRFAGEDIKRNERIQQQKKQMFKWIQEQIAEKSQLKHLQQVEDMNYAEMLKAIDEIRASTEREEEELRQYVRMSNKSYNQELAIAQRTRNHNQNRVQSDNNEPISLTLGALLNEDKSLAVDEYGHILRRDLFKGFTETQKKRILLDNQNIVMQKQQERDDERNREFEWAVQQVLILRAMEQAEFEDKLLRDAQDKERFEHIRQQMNDQTNRRTQSQVDKFGTISKGFFDGFGTSCR